jgi:plastocyanin
MRKGGFMKFGIVFALLSALIVTACGTRSIMPAAMPHQSMDSVTTIPLNDDIATPPPNKVGIRLSGEAVTHTHYGSVLGYFNGLTSTSSEVVSVPTGQRIRFFNVDTSRPHTASLLGVATSTVAAWPASFDGSATQSPASTAISTKGFSTGVLQPGTHSLLYSTGAPGFFMFGCAIHYNSNKMRTVIIVH